MASLVTLPVEALPRWRGLAIVACSLAVPLGLTLWATQRAARDERASYAARSDQGARLAERILSERLEGYQHVLMGAQGLWAARQQVAPAEWAAFIQALDLKRHHPGLLDLGLARPVGPGGVDQVEHGASLPWPLAESSATGRALAFDPKAEAVAREAARRAADEGRLVATPALLLRLDGQPQSALLVFLAVYDPTAADAGLAGRRAALLGWVYGTLGLHDLAQGLTAGGEATLDLVEGPALGPAPVPGERALQGSPSLAGRNLTLLWQDPPPAAVHTPFWIAVGGLSLTGLVGLTVQALVRTRQRAIALARRMTDDLRASESSARAVLVSVAEGIVSVGVDGRIRSFSPAAEAVFGCEAAAALDRPLVEFLPDLVRPAAGRLETRARHAQRGDVPVEVAVTAMHDGRRSGFVVVVHDISERRREERERAAQHGVTRALAESVAAEDALPRVLEALGTSLGFEFGAIWLVDRGAGLLRPAATWVALPGTCEALEAETRALCLPPGRGIPGRVWLTGEPAWVPDLASAESFTRRAAGLASGMRHAQAHPLALGSEVLGVLEFLGHEMKAPSESQQALLDGVGSQVAQFLERAAADRARRAADDRARSVVDSMLEGLVVCDAEGRIEELNPAAERTFGYGSWELVGRPVALLLEHELAGDHARFVREAWLPSLGSVREWQARRKGGRAFPVSLALVEFHTAEGRRLLAGHVRDLSEERQAERTKNEFVATVSHELRTPLTSIRGALALLTSGALGELPDEARDVVDIAERNTLRLSTLINDILDLERLESGRLEMRTQTVTLADVVDRALESVAGLAEAAGVPVEAERSACRVRADADRLVQVLVNLLANAVKFSPAGAPVRVECHAVGAQVEVRVIDQGRGVPAEMQPHLFERFQQVEASDAREKGGSGLGLAICRAIVDQHGGQIGLESEPGQGSTFWFRVPLALEQPVGADALLRTLEAGVGLGPDVLLVDSDPELPAVMARQLLQAGLPARAARDVPAAERARAQQAPAVVVLDPALPGAAGLCRRLEACRPVPALVLYTSADGPDQERRRLGLAPGVPVLTRSRETSGQLAGLVRKLYEEAASLAAKEAS